MQLLGNFNKIVYRRLQSLLTKFRTELLYCTVQGILYQMLPEPNWLVLGDHSSRVHVRLDPCGALNLVCSRQLMSDHKRAGAERCSNTLPLQPGHRFPEDLNTGVTCSVSMSTSLMSLHWLQEKMFENVIYLYLLIHYNAFVYILLFIQVNILIIKFFILNNL